MNRWTSWVVPKGWPLFPLSLPPALLMGAAEGLLTLILLAKAVCVEKKQTTLLFLTIQMFSAGFDRMFAGAPFLTCIWMYTHPYIQGGKNNEKKSEGFRGYCYQAAKVGRIWGILPGLHFWSYKSQWRAICLLSYHLDNLYLTFLSFHQNPGRG